MRQLFEYRFKGQMSSSNRLEKILGIREDNHGSKHGGWRIHRTIPTHCKDCQEAYCQAVWDQQLCHMEAVLKVAELADAEDIILEEQEDSPRPDNPDITRFWRAKNNWLYDLIDSTITTQARVYFKQAGGLQALEVCGDSSPRETSDPPRTPSKGNTEYDTTVCWRREELYREIPRNPHGTRANGAQIPRPCPT
ncbi:conserved hypothetical protein [Coccidioides posadasii str. Silveira]|uniref:Uncharacterized protein n=1 Tax=Coccidioides posadasii (strain RMSCC 757 / Silveira) TaxID=443226 RepID=E9D1U2_COCPS|nr:conserved hypothetical protein [Coccidioides posadasii str. Silveira]